MEKASDGRRSAASTGMPGVRNRSRGGTLAVGIVAVATLALLQLGSAAAGPVTTGGQPDGLAPLAKERQVREAYGRLPLSFVADAGHTATGVRYSAQAPGFSVAFTPEKVSLALVKKEAGAALDLYFPGASVPARLEARRQQPGKVNYLIGNDPAKWRSGLSTYGEVVYRSLWPGVDMVFRGAEGQLKYEFALRAGARVQDIRLGYRGAQGLSLDRRGNLLIRTPLGVLEDARPSTYQEIGGKRVPIASRFVLARDGTYGFAVGAHDSRRPLVIDPGLLYSTFLGGSDFDRGEGIAVDATGSAYVTGETASTNFPTTPGAFDNTHTGGRLDVFVTKLNPSGSAPLYSTYLGGSDDDLGRAIAVDSAGSVYVTGFTNSSDFPTTPGAFDTTYNDADAFVTKLNPAGSAPLLYSTFLGGSGSDEAFGIAVDAGSAYVTGATRSSDFPTTPGAFDTTYGGSYDVFVARLNASGSAPLLYSTYLGESGDDSGNGIAVDAAGNAHVAGHTSSASFPTTLGAFDSTFNGAYDAFVTKLNPAGSAPLVYSTYLGGGGFDAGRAIAVDAAGSAHFTGETRSSDFPTTPGAFDGAHNGGARDAFVTKLSASGSAPLVYSTFLGGSGDEIGEGIALDGSGSAYVTGSTSSSDFPLTPDAVDTTAIGFEGFVTKLNAGGSAPLLFSTYLGGSGLENSLGIAVDGSGSAYVAGGTFSADFPTTPGAFDTTLDGQADAFVAKLSTGAVPATLVLTPTADSNPVGTPHTVTATVEDAGGNPVSGVTVRFSVMGANSASGSDVTDANGQATFTYTGAVAGTDTISAFADTDGDGTQDPGEPGGIAAKLWTPGAPATLTLDPAADTNTVGETHCVTATVRDVFGNPVQGVTVVFDVPTAVATQASPSSGADDTDADGEATFCFSASLPGADAIHAFADTNGDGNQDAGEPSGDATKTWLLPPSTELCEVKITQGGWIVADNGDQASFGGNAKVMADGAAQGQEEYQDHGPAQPTNVHSIGITAVTCADDLQSATIYGTATIDGSGIYVFRIDVTDLGSPGSNDTYGIILSNGYASGQNQLQGGNVTIHKS